jgi:hypothetical protein
MINKQNKTKWINIIRTSVNIMHKENKRQNKNKLHIALVLKEQKKKIIKKRKIN